MNTPTTRRLLLAAALSGAVLAGCVPVGTTGTATGGCDPNGFGPFSGCGGQGDSTEQVAEPATGGCDPAGFGPLSGCGSDAQDDTESSDSCWWCGSPDAPDEQWMIFAARHEAGHVVVARALGWRLDSAELFPNGDGETRVYEDKGDPQGMVALYAAGAIAADSPAGAESDEAQIDEALADFPILDQDRIERAGRDQAEEIVNSHSAEIDQVAADILDDGELS